MKLKIKAGTTSKRIKVFIQDSSSATGAGLTGLLHNSASLVACYIKDGDSTATAITLVTATVGTYTSGGFKEIDATNLPGMYEIGIPNAAISSGNACHILLKGATNMVPCPIEIELDAVDYQTNAFGALTTLGTNAPADWINAAAVATGAFTAAKFASDFFTTIWASLTSGMTTAGSIGKHIVDNLNAQISSRMATFSLPANFASMLISVAGKVTVGTNDDKTGYALSSASIDAIDAALLNAGDATDLIASIIARLNNTNVDQTAFVAAVKASLFDAGSIANKLSVDGSGRVAVGTIASNAMNASALAADAVVEIRDAIVNYTDGSGPLYATILGASSAANAAAAVTAKLDTMLEMNIAVYQFTVGAFTNMPAASVSPSGIRSALGMATANLDDQLALKPSYGHSQRWTAPSQVLDVTVTKN